MLLMVETKHHLDVATDEKAMDTAWFTIICQRIRHQLRKPKMIIPRRMSTEAKIPGKLEHT